MTSMITTTVTVTHADSQKFGPDAWLVQSVIDGEVDPAWTVENVPYGLSDLAGRRNVAARLHLARTHTGHRVDRMGRLAEGEEADLQAEVDDYSLRAFRAELRLIAKG